MGVDLRCLLRGKAGVPREGETPRGEEGKGVGREKRPGSPAATDRTGGEIPANALLETFSGGKSKLDRTSVETAKPPRKFGLEGQNRSFRNSNQ